MMYHDSLSFRRLLLPPASRTARVPITYTPVYPPPKGGQSIDHGTADEGISLSNKVQNHIDAQISSDSVYRFIKPRILGLPECSAPWRSAGISPDQNRFNGLAANRGRPVCGDQFFQRLHSSFTDLLLGLGNGSQLDFGQ